MNAIALKTSNQNTIECYRLNAADLDTYFMNMIKKIDAVDIGSGLNCAHKLDAIASVQNECEDQGLQKLNDLKQNAQKVTEIINNLDAQQVEEKLKSSNRRYNDLIKRIARKAQMIGATNKGIRSVQSEIEQLNDWLTKQITSLQGPHIFNADSIQLNLHLQKLKAISKEADVKQVHADTLERRVANMQTDLEILERSQFDSDLREISNKQGNLADLITSEIDRTNAILQQLKAFETDVDRFRAWIRTKLIEIKKQPKTIPLASASIEKEIQAVKTIEAENSKDGTDAINGLQKQAQSILNHCSNQKSLEPLLEGLDKEFTELKTEPSVLVKHLTDALEVRKTLENNVSNLEDWFTEIEIITQSDIQLKSLSILEERLLEFERLKKHKEQMRPILNKVNECSKSISPTLNNVDKMKLNEQLKTLKDKFDQPTVADRIKAIEDHIKKCKLSKDKLSQCIEVLNKLQQEIRDLHKPIGIDAAGVKEQINSYERILRRLNDNKNKIYAIQVEDLPELPSVLSKNDETICAVEKQISNLRQAHAVREQYVALVNHIETMIGTLVVQIADIEKSEKPIEDKLNQYDESTSQIQECEGFLASVQDRSQKIASEGTVADGNAIAENNQRIKQKLQNLYKQIRAQREKLENTMAEHNKLASELSELLLWLHNNESSCKSRPYLERDPDSVNHETSKQEILTTEVQTRLDQVQKIDEESENDNSIPTSVIDMLSEGRSLIANLPKELSDRKKYLEDSKQHRIDYIKYINEFKNWVHQAEGHLENCKHGIDFKNIASDIDKFKSFFETDRPVKELITEKIQSTVDHIWPTLQTIEQNELSDEVRQHKKLLDKTLNSSKQEQAHLTKRQNDWVSYRDMFDSLRNMLDSAQIESGPADSLSNIHTTLETNSNILFDLKVSHLILKCIDILSQKYYQRIIEIEIVFKYRITFYILLCGCPRQNDVIYSVCDLSFIYRLHSIVSYIMIFIITYFNKHQRIKV